MCEVTPRCTPHGRRPTRRAERSTEATQERARQKAAPSPRACGVNPTSPPPLCPAASVMLAGLVRAEMLAVSQKKEEAAVTYLQQEALLAAGPQSRCGALSCTPRDLLTAAQEPWPPPAPQHRHCGKAKPLLPARVGACVSCGLGK